MLGAATFKSSETINRCVIKSDISAKLSANVFEAYSCDKRDKIDGNGNDDGDDGDSSFGFFQKFILNAASATTLL